MLKYVLKVVLFKNNKNLYHIMYKTAIAQNIIYIPRVYLLLCSVNTVIILFLYK